MENIEICCSLQGSPITAEEIVKLLPKWKTQVLNVTNTNSQIKIYLRITANTVEHIKKWLQAYEEISSCTYSVRTTNSCTGHIVQYKQRLHCQHNTRCRRTCDPSDRKFTRNTNCPSTITVKLRTIRNKYRGKDDSKAPNPAMPCEIVLAPTHNHTVSLHFRKVSPETEEKLVTLFTYGHSPATALDSLKMHIRLNNENFETLMADRKYCPDYSYCYRLYVREFVKKYGLFEESNEILIKWLEKYNKDTNDDSAQVVFQDSGFVLCICPPLLKRVHENIKAASEIVYIDSLCKIETNSNRIYLLFTHSECGGLPLGVIVTSTCDSSNISIGFHLLKKMVGPKIFGGNLEGPTVFLINDPNEESAVHTVWSKSQSLLCTFRVLRTVWKWLQNPKNEIQLGDQPKLFQGFRSIMFATTLADVDAKYKVALQDARRYLNYQSYLNSYWECQQVWVLCYRAGLLTQENEINNFSEAAVRLLNVSIFERTKTFNLVQMADFIVTIFMGYYEKRLLDAAHNRLIRNVNDTVPPSGVLDRIQQLSEKVYLVPCEAASYIYYIVSGEALKCTCRNSKCMKICKHVHWLNYHVNSKRNVPIHNKATKRTYYIVATGNEPIEDKKIIHKVTNSCIILFVTPTSGSVQIPQTVKHIESSNSQLLVKGRNLIQRIADQCKSFLETSPVKAIEGLEMINQHFRQLKTVSEFVSWCGSEFTHQRPKLHKQRRLVQRTILKKREAQILNSRSRLIRRNYKVPKRTNHCV